LVELDKKNIEEKLFTSEFNFEDSSMFKELMSLYPWCSSFTVAYLKSLCALDDLRFASELEKYAVQLNSRAVLYELIHGIAEKEMFSDTLDTSIPEPSPAENKIDLPEEKIESESVEDKISDSSDSDESELEKLISSKIISDNYINELAADKTDESEKSPEDNIEQAAEIEPHLIKESTKEEDIDDSPRSFGAWLKMGKDSMEDSSEKEFLTFEKPKKEFFSSSTKAKESIGLENLPVSETLAKVFESQGNYSMAISTYEQLILIFPEKKISFANQIEKIKTKIK